MDCDRYLDIGNPWTEWVDPLDDAEEMDCPECDGMGIWTAKETGEKNDTPCENCRGTGILYHNEKADVWYDGNKEEI